MDFHHCRSKQQEQKQKAARLKYLGEITSRYFPTSLCGVLVFGCALPPGPAWPRLSAAPTCTHNLLPHNLSPHNLSPHNLLTHNLHTHTQLVTTQLVTTQLVTTQLDCTQLAHTHTTCTHTHTTYTHTHNLSPHNLLTHNLHTHTHNLLTTQLVHTHTHTSCSHTTCHHTTYTHTQLVTTSIITLCGIYRAGLAPVARLGWVWCRGRRRCLLCRPGRRGTWRHRRAFCVAGMALIVLGWLRWRAWVGFGTVVAAAVCVAGMALGDIDRHFAWQVWYLATWTCILRGRRGTYRAGLAPVVRLGWVWRWVAAAVGVAAVALGDIELHFACAGLAPVALGLGLAPWSPPPFAWQAWHLATSIVTLRGRRGRRGDMDMHSAWQAWHLSCWAGSGGALGLGFALWSLPPLAWKAWRLVTSSFILRGRRGTCGNMDVHSAWQAWRLSYWAGSGGALGFGAVVAVAVCVAARHRSQPSTINAMPATQNARPCRKYHTCHAKWRSMSPSAMPATQTVAATTAPNPTQARHRSQPSTISATPATQNAC